MDNLQIRTAKSDEWDKVIDIYRRENLENELDLVTKDAKKEFTEINDKRIIWFAELENRVIGVIQLVLPLVGLVENNRYARLHHLRISKEFEGQGIASRLIKMAEDEVKRRKIKIINLEVEKNNKRARMIYEHLGYKYTKDGMDPNEIILTKYIS